MLVLVVENNGEHSARLSITIAYAVSSSDDVHLQ